jgi:cytochrome c biogenesis protein CcmG/thiol:disulfide interchange protein DsbE
MRKQILTFLAVLLTTTFSFSQESRSLPDVKVKTLQGDAFNISELDNDGKPIVISFWATWCKPCKKEIIFRKYMKIGKRKLA